MVAALVGTEFKAYSARDVLWGRAGWQPRRTGRRPAMATGRPLGGQSITFTWCRALAYPRATATGHGGDLRRRGRVPELRPLPDPARPSPWSTCPPRGNIQRPSTAGWWRTTSVSPGTWLDASRTGVS